MTRLVVGYPAALHVAVDGTVAIDEKLRSGVAGYRAAWPGGDVVLAAPHTSFDEPLGLGARRRGRDDLGFELVTGDTWRRALDDARGDLYLLPLTHRTAEVEHLLDRAVLTAEFTPEDLAATERRGAGGVVAQARIGVGSARRRRQFETWVRRALGIQCNGYPAFERFGPLSTSPLLFFDTRLTADHVRLARETERSTPSSPFRLCFSGRLIDAKGPQHAVAVADRLTAAGVACTLDVIGVGPLGQELRRTAGPNVRFKDPMDFAQGWTTYVRDEVDLMVLPHTQGDPSGTYLEAAGSGVPVVGFDNVALAALVAHHGLGVAVPLGDDAALSAAAEAVLDDTARWTNLREHGLTFMAKHCYENEASRRIQHLVAVSVR